jgi:hypothetical protein
MFCPTCGCEMKQKSVLDTLFECGEGHRESPIKIEYMPLTPEEKARLPRCTACNGFLMPNDAYCRPCGHKK